MFTELLLNSDCLKMPKGKKPRKREPQNRSPWLPVVVLAIIVGGLLGLTHLTLSSFLGEDLKVKDFKFDAKNRSVEAHGFERHTHGYPFGRPKP